MNNPKCLAAKIGFVFYIEGALYNPSIFLGKQPPVWEMADKYIAYAEKYRPPLGYIRGHLFCMWHHW